MTPAALTIAEIAPLLDPPMTPAALDAIVARLPGLHPVGTRARGRGTAGGRPARTYDVDQIMELHAAIAPWL